MRFVTSKERVRSILAAATGAVALIGSLFPIDAWAQAALYHSAADDGLMPAVTPVLATPGPEWLHLYADSVGSAATVTGTPCDDGDGDEICGWRASIEAGPGTILLSFLPVAGVYHTLSATQLQANAVHAISPTVAPVKIGDLLVQSTNAATGGTIEATGIEVVTAGLLSHPVAFTTVAVVPAPEPGHVAGLLAGLVWLGLLAQRTSWRSTLAAHSSSACSASRWIRAPLCFRTSWI